MPRFIHIVLSCAVGWYYSPLIRIHLLARTWCSLEEEEEEDCSLFDQKGPSVHSLNQTTMKIIFNYILHALLSNCKP